MKGRYILIAGIVSVLLHLSHISFAEPVFQATSAVGEDDEENWDEEEGTGRSFFYKEVVLSGFYSANGVMSLPPGDMTPDHSGLSYRPPMNYIAVDYIKTFDSLSYINKKLLPGWLPVSALDFHPRIVYARMEMDQDRIKFAPQDFWVRFNPGAQDRLTLLLGQFVIPYGVNPILAPRQRFILPVEATDLGLKWDWGLAVRGPVGEYDWELAATMGSGTALHFNDTDGTSYLLTGRIGAPTYWDFQYGFSALYGAMPVTRGPTRMGTYSIPRWRAGLDFFYKLGTYLMVGAQVTYGQNGFSDDDLETTDVLGYRLAADWVVPGYLNWRLAGQFESINRDIAVSDASDTAIILEATYSFTTTISLMLDYRVELSRSMGEKDNAVFLTFIYYG